MKKVFSNIISVSLAHLVLFSTLSFTVDKHFCGDILMDMAIFSKAESCGMEVHEHYDSTGAFVDESNCCKNQKTAVEGQDKLKTSYNSLELDLQIFQNSFLYSYLNLFKSLPGQVVPFKNYTPPLLVVNLQVLDQVFLI